MSLWALIGLALAQDYRFPGADEDVGAFGVSLYVDHDGLDWSCGARTASGQRGTEFVIDGFEGMDVGRTVVAAADGVVVAIQDGEDDRCTTGDCGAGSGYGNYVNLRHADGRETLYAHLRNASIPVVLGQKVTCGETVGDVGSSGNSTEPHLFFGLRDAEGQWADPYTGDCSEDDGAWVEQGAYEGLPAALCDAPLSCEPLELLSCGAAVEGDTNGNGSTEEIGWYGCTDWVYSGPELAYNFVTDRDESVTITATRLESDVDLYVLADDGCSPETCVVYSGASETSDETVTFDAAAGVVYSVVLDGYGGASSPFLLTTACAGSIPVPDTGGDSAEPDSETIDTSVIDTSDPWGPLRLSAGVPPDGCGCGDGESAAMLVLLAALGLGRRRRAG